MMPDIATERDAIALFERLMEVPAADRDAWLVREAGGRADLVQRVAAMLKADAAARLRTGGGSDAVDAEIPPERIGAYRIVERIGLGGMGSVYRGERDSGDFTHVVAIKVIKPGLLSDTLVERFRRERQLLAGLSHPNIAQLYDGGETANGSPYLVMEFVDGLPLLQWIDEREVSRSARQALFLDICSAVAVAHRNLVVHRDLTPSNVMVTWQGVVKLIDFGIARPADAPGIAKSGYSSIGSLSLTPGYAAPERLTSNDVTTAIDIFSLGKLLRRLIPPSRGDRELNAIVARATIDDPADRYPTAEALGDDVAAWRDGLPVQAVAGAGRYRLAKFVSRHRAAVSATAAALFLSVAAFGVTVNAYDRAETARRAEVARFQELRSLAGFMLFQLNGQLTRVVGTSAARETLANRAQTYLSALAASPSADASLKVEAAQGLIALADVQGVPAQTNLGQSDRARANLRTAIGLLRPLPIAAATKAPVLARGLASSAMIEAHIDSDVAGAARQLGEAVRILGAVPGNARDLTWLGARRRVRHAQVEIAILGQKPDDLGALARRLVLEIGEWPAPARYSRDAAFDRAYAVYLTGLSGYFQGKLAAATDQLRRSEAMFAAIERAMPNDAGVLYAMLWNDYVGYGAATGFAARRGDATYFLKRAVAAGNRLISIEPRDHALQAFTGNIRQIEAQALSSDGDHRGAQAVQSDVLRLYTAALGPKRKPGALNRLTTAHITMGDIARRAGDRAAACASYRTARGLAGDLAKRRELLGTTAVFVAGLDRNIARCARGGAVSEMEIFG